MPRFLALCSTDCFTARDRSVGEPFQERGFFVAPGNAFVNERRERQSTVAAVVVCFAKDRDYDTLSAVFIGTGLPRLDTGFQDSKPCYKSRFCPD